MKKILLIDDERNIHYSFRRLFKGRYDIISAYEAREGFKKIQENNPDLVLLDVKMPFGDGLEMLRRIKETHSHIPVIIMTAFGTTETAINAMKLEAYDYVLKPFDVKAFSELIGKALEVKDYLDSFRAKEGGDETKDLLIGQSAGMQEVYKMIGRLARTDVTVLLYGESGTGKELVAKQIHEHSNRRRMPLVAINCAAIPENLIEAELFGHEKDAFTGASSRKKGLFELANGSTLFLDEIGELSLPLQTKFLRVLQEKEIVRLGGKEAIKVDVRIIAATNRNLEDAVRSSLFREDLYYRLNVVCINLPPLRTRMEDIPLLNERFLMVMRKEFQKPFVYLSPEALEVLILHDWPGNVRELENVLREAVVKAKGVKIMPEDLKVKTGTFGQLREGYSKNGKSSAYASQNIKEAISDFLSLNKGSGYEKLEEEAIRQSLTICKGNQVKAASLLGITRNMLRHRLKRYNI